MNNPMPFMVGTANPWEQPLLAQQQPILDALRQSPQNYGDMAQTQLQPVTGDAASALAQPLGQALGNSGNYLKNNYDIANKYGTGFMTEQTRGLQAADAGF